MAYSGNSPKVHTTAMLSNPLQRFSPYHNLPSSSLISNGHVPPPPMHSNGMDPMGQNPHYGMQQLQHVSVSNPHLARSAPQPRQRQHPYGPSGRSSSTSGPVRRRISRACDQCNQLRTKCDGQHPCAHCIGKQALPRFCSLPDVELILCRVWPRVRIRSRAKEAWQGIAQGSRPTGSSTGCCRRWQVRLRCGEHHGHRRGF